MSVHLKLAQNNDVIRNLAISSSTARMSQSDALNSLLVIFGMPSVRVRTHGSGSAAVISEERLRASTPQVRA